MIAREGKDQPNIILMFIDDLGYGDIGPFGCKDIPTPFSGGKGQGTQKEGRVRTPAIFSQPGVLPEGKVYEGMICSLDLCATFAALSGQTAPALGLRCGESNVSIK